MSYHHRPMSSSTIALAPSSASLAASAHLVGGKANRESVHRLFSSTFSTPMSLNDEEAASSASTHASLPSIASSVTSFASTYSPATFARTNLTDKVSMLFDESHEHQQPVRAFKSGAKHSILNGDDHDISRSSHEDDDGEEEEGTERLRIQHDDDSNEPEANPDEFWAAAQRHKPTPRGALSLQGSHSTFPATLLTLSPSKPLSSNNRSIMHESSSISASSSSSSSAAAADRDSSGDSSSSSSHHFQNSLGVPLAGDPRKLSPHDHRRGSSSSTSSGDSANEDEQRPLFTRAVSFEDGSNSIIEPQQRSSSSSSSSSPSSSSLSSSPQSDNSVSPAAPSASHSAASVRQSHMIHASELHGRYKLVRFLGSGSYGHVHVAEEIATGRQVAIKKIVHIFDNLTNAKRLLREIKILRMLHHQNIIKLKELLPPAINTPSSPSPSSSSSSLAPASPASSASSFNDLLIVFEFVETDLQRLIHSDQSFSNDHVQYFLYQLLLGVAYMQSASIIHRDLKPANVLVNSDCSLKICDFGLARTTGAETIGTAAPGAQLLSVPGVPAAPMTPLPHSSSASSTPPASSSSSSTSSSSSLLVPTLNSRPSAAAAASSSTLPVVGLLAPKKLTRELTKHVVTRWYRAPELILLSARYTTAIDMWSVGCILAELLAMQTHSYRSRQPLFPGKTCFPFSADNPLAYTDHLDQLNVIFDVLGTPSSHDIEKIDNEKARNYLKSLPARSSIHLSSRFPGADERAIDLLTRLLTFDPDARITAQQALAHPYLQELRTHHEEKDSEISQPPTMTGIGDFSFEDGPINKTQIRDLIIEEVCRDHPGLNRASYRHVEHRSPRPRPRRSSDDFEEEQPTSSAKRVRH